MHFPATQDTPFAQRRKGPPLEYRLIFALIFLFHLPVALREWLAGLLRPRGSGPNPGMLRRALSQAHAITPMIFSA